MNAIANRAASILAIGAFLALFPACLGRVPQTEPEVDYKAKYEACEKRYEILLEATKAYRSEVLRLEQDCR